eukprot:scaffold6067_cov112-Isochrysis_galbana.AAC.19
MTASAAAETAPSGSPSHMRTSGHGMSAAVYLAAKASVADSSASLARKKTSLSAAQLSPRSSHPMSAPPAESAPPEPALGDTPSDGGEAPGEDPMVSSSSRPVAGSAARPRAPAPAMLAAGRCTETKAAAASLAASPQVHPEARAKRRQAQARVVLPRQVMPAWSATHHDRASAL